MLGLIAILRRFFAAARRGLSDPEFRGLLSIVGVLLASGTVFYRQAEGWTFLDSFYFSVITLTTVGYGDLHPTTGISKLVTVFYIIIGLGIILAFVERVARHASAEAAARRSRRRGTATTED
jgi:hypothetical protein